MRAFLIVKRFFITNLLYILCTIFTALAVIYLENTVSHKYGLFLPTQLVLSCLFPSVKTLAKIINATLTINVFVYFVITTIKIAEEMGTTAEPELVSQPILIFFSVLVSVIVQNLILEIFFAYCS
ncbi:hypothetical protein [Nostoc sp. FACHB-110]|uniref:hypothetical protein n=1 Tax=Nostoc sp. FACHB-110 TaxID=2692834 RepID=UPI001689BA7D|nr:hypothetical protein [Nostoc sp. FACHB-110]MBD2438856.1 hypothetical protein [Nostoc sp. FACHB-110]